MTKETSPWTVGSRRASGRLLPVAALSCLLAGSCVRNPAPVEPAAPPPPPGVEDLAPVPQGSPTPRAEPPPIPPALPEEDFASRSLEEINRAAPLEPVFFDYDSIELDAAAQNTIASNADVLAENPTWAVTVEGHCDSRGTPEYNLALGERRALAVRDQLVRLGVDPSRVRMVSYGEEFPFVPGDVPEAWAANRRAHFVITAQ